MAELFYTVLTLFELVEKLFSLFVKLVDLAADGNNIFVEIFINFDRVI